MEDINLEEIDIVSTFNPLDALESISKMYKTKQLSKVDILKIQTQAKCFNKWITEQKDENKETRKQILESAEDYRKGLRQIIDRVLQNPEMVNQYKTYFEELLKANNELILKISEIRIKSKYEAENEISNC